MPTEKEDLIQVSSDTNLKSKFQGVFVDSFWISPKNECPEIVNKYVDILLPFPTSYLREAALSTTKKMKSNNRSTLGAVDSAMQVDISTIRRRIKNYMTYTTPKSLIGKKKSSKYSYNLY